MEANVDIYDPVTQFGGALLRVMAYQAEVDKGDVTCRLK